MEEAAGSQRETSSIQTLMEADLQDLEEGRLSGRTRLEKAEARASTKALSLMLVNAIIEHRSIGGRPLYLVFHQVGFGGNRCWKTGEGRPLLPP
jgi:hypothetical protein